MNKATSALLQQNDLDEDLKSAINKIAVKLGTGATMMGIITALVSMSGWIQYLDSSFTKWYYSEIEKLAEPTVMQIMQDLGKAGQAEGSIWGKLGMYAFFIFFTIAVISLVAARMTKSKKNEGDVVPGGLAKGLSLNDIAEKHGVSVDIMVAQFKKGISVEMEHTTDREVAKEITLDHLFEDPKYYDKLAKVEEYVDKKGVEHVAAALPQTEEEPIKEGNECGCK
jgi:predicted RND superfamily exporter protein